MNSIFEFFFDLLMLIWGNVEKLLQPIFKFLSSFTEFAIPILTDFLSWLLGAINKIIDIIEKIGKFFGL